MTAPSPADPLGYDALIGPEDLDPTGRSATGLELVDAAVIHRLTCERLYMIDSPTLDEDGYGVVAFGVNVRKWPGEVIDRAGARAKIPLIDEALHRDPRFRKADIDVQIAPPGTRFGGPDGGLVDLLIYITYTTLTGEVVSRIVGVSQVTVDFLAGGG